jgi:hypothetical protein
VNVAVGYFIDFDAQETYPQTWLSGDRNILSTKATPARTDVTKAQIIKVVSNAANVAATSWSPNDVHQGQGDIALGDGSVQQLSTSRLREAMKTTGLDTANITGTMAFPD